MQGGGEAALNQVLPAVSVVIPAKVLTERLMACLEALDAQTAGPHGCLDISAYLVYTQLSEVSTNADTDEKAVQTRQQ